MELSVIVSYYQAIENLKLILKAFEQQSVSKFEVIISEDDYNLETIRYLEENRSQYFYPIIHLHQQEDKGFRKNMMLNRSVVKANSKRLAFIDGDCVPHKHFVKSYIQYMEEAYYYTGRAVMLSEKAAKVLLERQSLCCLQFWFLFFFKCTQIKDGIYFPFFPLSIRLKGLVGRNWGILKKNIIAVNGFDEDYVLAGVGEDVDIGWRLRELGIREKSIKNKAIVYHVYHPRGYSEADVQSNFKLFRSKQSTKHIQCLRGIKELLI